MFFSSVILLNASVCTTCYSTSLWRQKMYLVVAGSRNTLYSPYSTLLMDSILDFLIQTFFRIMLCEAIMCKDVILIYIGSTFRRDQSTKVILYGLYVHSQNRIYGQQHLITTKTLLTHVLDQLMLSLPINPFQHFALYDCAQSA